MTSLRIGMAWAGIAFFLASAGMAWSRTISLAERRTVMVNGQPKVVVSKLSRLNPNTERVRAVMDLNFTYNFHHMTSKEMFGAMLDRFGVEEGWVVTHYRYNDPNKPGIDDRARITFEELQRHQVVFANNISAWGDQGETPVNKAVERYMLEAEGGVFLLHGSAETWASRWKFFREQLHPVNFAGHGNIIPGYILRPPGAALHPVMEGGILDTGLLIRSEWMVYDRSILAAKPEAEVLMMIDPERCPGCIYDSKYVFEGGNPIAWVIPAGNGRAGYFQEGHDTWTVKDFTAPVLERFVKQMLFYLAGYDTLEAPSSIPGYAREYSGVSFDPAAMAVFIELPGRHKVSLLDVRGVKLMEAEGEGVAEHSFEAKRGSLRTGVYVLRVDTGPGKVLSKRYLVRR